MGFKMGMDARMVFSNSFVVKLDVRSMNEVTLLHYIYIIFLLSYYNHINFAKVMIFL